MTGYERFQQIMAEINYKKQIEESKKSTKDFDLPPGFEELFKGFNDKK